MPASAISPLGKHEEVSWLEVMQHVAKRLANVNSSFRMTVLTDKELRVSALLSVVLLYCIQLQSFYISELHSYTIRSKFAQVIYCYMLNLRPLKTGNRASSEKIRAKVGSPDGHWDQRFQACSTDRGLQPKREDSTVL